jgi:hypothetical protein
MIAPRRLVILLAVFTTLVALSGVTLRLSPRALGSAVAFA